MSVQGENQSSCVEDQLVFTPQWTQWLDFDYFQGREGAKGEHVHCLSEASDVVYKKSFGKEQETGRLDMTRGATTVLCPDNRPLVTRRQLQPNTPDLSYGEQ